MNTQEPTLLYQTERKLNNTFSYKLSIFDLSVQDSNIIENILIEASPDKKAPAVEKNFSIAKKELADILGLENLENNYDKVADLVIIEGMRELNITKRRLGDNFPNININLTSSDNFSAPLMLSNSKDSCVVQAEPQRSQPNIRFTLSKPKQDKITTKAAIKIQSFIRKNKAKQQLKQLKIDSDSLCVLEDTIKCKIDNKKLVVFIFKIENAKRIEILDIESKKTFRMQISHNRNTESILEDIRYNGKEFILIKNHNTNIEHKDTNKSLFIGQKLINNENWDIKISLIKDNFIIEMSLQQKLLRKIYKATEITEKYDLTNNFERLYQDLTIKDKEITLNKSFFN